MSTPAQIPAKPHLDGRAFQTQLASLANTIALKVQREGPKILPRPDFVTVDIFVLLRQALHTYDLFFFLKAVLEGLRPAEPNENHSRVGS